MANPNTLTTGTSALSVEMQTYYDRQMLENMKPKLVHYQYGQKRPIPRHRGKTIQFRKWTPFAANTTALAEGVTPDGDSLEATEVTATIEQLGRYITVSDLLDMTALDPVVSDAVDMMADQAALSVDTYIRNKIHAGTSYQIANGKLYRYRLAAGDVLNTTEIRKAVRTLKKAKALPFNRGGKSYYVAIVGPDTTYDLQSDTLWQNVSTYQDKEAIFNGEIGRLFGVVFVETTEAKIFEAENLLGATANLTAKAASSYNAGTKVLTIHEALSAAQAAALAGRKVLVNTATQHYDTIVEATEGVADAATIKLTTGYGGTATDLDGKTIYPGEAGASGIDVASTLVFGQNAYGVVDIENSGRPRTIVKSAKENGADDPLEQRSSIGWKVDAFTAVILQQTFMVRIEHGFTA